MRAFAFIVLAAAASAQEIPAVRLAGQGFFPGGSSANGALQNQNVILDSGLQQGDLNGQFLASSVNNLEPTFGTQDLSTQFDSFQQGQDQLRGSEFGGIVNGVFEPLNLPAGASLILGSIDFSFQCTDRPYGYYADQGNACRVFHVCNPYLFSDGSVETIQYSFMCGEGQIFDQRELTCVEEFKALPCQEAANFYFRNEDFGLPEEKF